MRYLIIILLISISWPTNAQLVTDTSATNKLLSLEMYLWQSAADSTKLVALTEKAEIYKSLRMHEQALAELQRAEKLCPDQLSISSVRYQEMLNYFLSAQYGHSREIDIPLSAIEGIHKKKEYFLMRLQSLNESEKWVECKKELLDLCTDSSKITLIQQLPITYSYKNPEECKRLSAILPGLGAIKAGYPLKGITSLLIHSGLIVFTGYNFYAGYYLTGTISGFLPMLKFYNGGKRLAENLAERHNEESKNLVKKKYNEMINQVIL